MCKSLPGGTGFEDMGWSWRTAKAWHDERTGEATGECAPSVAAEGPGLKESCREAES